MDKLLKTVLISASLAALLPNAGHAVGLQNMLHFVASDTGPDLKAMEGKRVLGKNRELLGHLGNVDEQAKMVELKTPSGAIVSIPTDVIMIDEDELAAPSLSRGDVIAMTNKPGDGPAVHEVGGAPKGGPVP
jgi:hypothetical protein